MNYDLQEKEEEKRGEDAGGVLPGGRERILVRLGSRNRGNRNHGTMMAVVSHLATLDLSHVSRI